jgi:transposase-like protein
MNVEPDGVRQAIRYSEAFKMQVVRELESQGLSFSAVTRKYGLPGRASVVRWVRKYGNGTRGKVIRVQKPEEIDELARLKQRVRLLETALADSNVDLALERAYTRLACQRAGIADVEEFKKKADGKPPIKR